MIGSEVGEGDALESASHVKPRLSSSSSTIMSGGGSGGRVRHLFAEDEDEGEEKRREGGVGEEKRREGGVSGKEWLKEIAKRRSPATLLSASGIEVSLLLSPAPQDTAPPGKRRDLVSVSTPGSVAASHRPASPAPREREIGGEHRSSAGGVLGVRCAEQVCG